MDILDIDEMLKDDSFHFLEEKNPDDVSNIIQQWKNQNCIHQQQQQQPSDLQQQQHNETFKLDSRTFTRPKRRSAAQKLETQFLNISNGIENQQPQQQIQQVQVPQQTQRQPTTPMLNVQIGGQIRHTPLSARSMLQDTSPPSSVCSMDTSLDNFNMDNSLITSADFTHLNFLLSTPSLEDSINFNEQNCGGYSLSDMIRDRKALESLTLSADDGTLIKDSQISQIDDISLSMLKGSSGCNSMANSAESVEGNHFGVNTNFNDRTMQVLPNNKSNSYRNLTLTGSSGDGSGPEVLHRTTVLNSDNRVSDETFTFSGNGQSFVVSRQPSLEAHNATEDTKHCADQVPLNSTRDHETEETTTHLLNEGTGDITTTKLKSMPLNQTMCIRRADESEKVSVAPPTRVPAANETYDCQQLQDELHKAQHTPENSTKDSKTANMYESTPHTTRMRYGGNKSSYTPAIRKINEDPNISPIIATTSNQQEQIQSPQMTQAAAAYSGSPLSHFADMELLENIENPNKTYNRRSRQRQQKLDDERELRHKNTIELQDIMDLAQAEAELLDANDGEDDEQQFEHMLDELSRIKLNPEQVKMQKSLEKIKKRFNCTLNQGEQDGSSRPHTSGSSVEYGSGLSNTFTSETRQETLQKLRDTLRYDTTTEISSGTRSNPSDFAFSNSGSAIGSGSGGSNSFITSTMASSGSSSGERLLNRRSRLNDDINITSIKQLSQCASGTDSSFTVPSKSVGNEHITTNTDNTVVQKETAAQSNAINVKPDDNDTAKYKLAEQRERDRDRFKTIKIVRNRNEDDENATRTILNVPCIDDDQDEHVNTQLGSEGSNEIAQNIHSENDHNKKELNTKSATSKRFSRSDLGNSEKESNSNTGATTTSGLRPPEARSLSRPRYINGLQKFSVVSKAVSAGDLEMNENNGTAVETKPSQLTRVYDAKKCNIPGSASSSIAKPTSKLKSPMGIKAKSLHNLAYSNQGSSTSAGLAAQSRISTFGLRKINSGGFGFEQQRLQKQPQQPTLQSKQKTFDNFKKPQAISGLQANTTREKSSSATNRSLAGIARPSSGYYSLNVTAKADIVPIVSKEASATMQPSLGSTGNITATGVDETKSSKIAANTGIPKPSGIRPPNKRSGLPRPSSIVRR